MADWANPTLSTAYTTFLTNLKDRDVDALTLCSSAPTNPPTGAMRYNRSTQVFEEWSGAAWVVKQITYAGLTGLGTFADKNVNAVPELAMSGSILFNTDIAYDIGSNAKKVRRLYVGEALVIPVGADKYATS